MYPQALSVPDALREVLGNNNVYLEALQLGIANYTALAEKIQPEIERLIGYKVNQNTIVVAIKRLVDALDKSKSQDIIKASMATKVKMSLTGSIIDINFQKENDDDDDVMTNVLDEFFEQENRYSLFQTDNHFTLLTEDADEIRKMVANAIEKFGGGVGNIKEDLSKITISLGPDEKSPYYHLSLISNILYNHQIPVHSAFFTPHEIVLILGDKDAARAYDLIRLKIGK
ncbi:MAG TPA: hypothetical protein VFS97_10105 [Nitrososphaeraceae archaeon]|nr:hypothetical protein [Nitrososphaeraceae archaeon]